MRIILSTENSLTAMRLREQIIKSVKGEIVGLSIETWSYTMSSDNFDILYHDPIQYTQDPSKNVLLKLEIDGSNVLLSSVWWEKNLKYTVQKDVMSMNDDGQMACREQCVTFTKEENKEKTITHHAKIVTYVDIKKTRAKLIPLLTNDMGMDAKDVWTYIGEDGK